MVDSLPLIQQLPHLRSHAFVPQIRRHAFVQAFRIIRQLFVVALSISRIGAVLQAELSAFEEVLGDGFMKALRTIYASFEKKFDSRTLFLFDSLVDGVRGVSTEFQQASAAGKLPFETAWFRGS
jgi:hypothetical protein